MSCLQSPMRFSPTSKLHILQDFFFFLRFSFLHQKMIRWEFPNKMPRWHLSNYHYVQVKLASFLICHWTVIADKEKSLKCILCYHFKSPHLLGLMEDHALYFLKVYWLSLRSISIPFLPLSLNKKKSYYLFACLEWFYWHSEFLALISIKWFRVSLVLMPYKGQMYIKLQ